MDEKEAVAPGEGVAATSEVDHAEPEAARARRVAAKADASECGAHTRTGVPPAEEERKPPAVGPRQFFSARGETPKICA